MFWLLLILSTVSTHCKSNEVGVLENLLTYYHPSGRNAYTVDIFKQLPEKEGKVFELGIPTVKENQLNLNLQGELVKQSQVNLWLDLNATVVLVFELINNSALGVNTLNTDKAILKLKSETVLVTLGYYGVANSDVYKFKVVFADRVFDHQHVFSPTQQISIPMVLNETRLNNYPKEYSICRGDSGGRMLMVSGWGVATTTKARKCHWPAFWLVVCPWYGMQHCQSK